MPTIQVAIICATALAIVVVVALAKITIRQAELAGEDKRGERAAEGGRSVHRVERAG